MDSNEQISQFGWRAAFLVLFSSLGVATSGPAFGQDCGSLQTVASMTLHPGPSKLEELVSVKLNGIEKSFLLDTGGGLSLVGHRTVGALNLPSVGRRTPIKTIGGIDEEQGVVVADFELGTMRAKDITLLHGPDLPPPLDGVLAPDLFLAYDLDMDFGHDTLNFVSSDHCAGKVVYWKSDVVAQVPMRIVDGHYLINIMLDGVPLVAMIDTGAVRTSMEMTDAGRYFGLDAHSQGVEPGPKFNGSVASWMHKFSGLAFEGVTIQNPTVALLLSHGLERDHFTTGTRIVRNTHLADIILGMDVLRHLHLYIATKERKLYVTPA